MKVRFDPGELAGPAPRFGTCLLHGSDADQIEERANEVTRRVAGSLDDPFRVATLSLEDHGRLTGEVLAGSLTGGRRVVRVRDCGERLLAALIRLGTGAPGGAAVVLLAGVLTRRSRLRAWADEAPHVASVLCNTDDLAQRRAFVDQALSQAGLSAAPDTKGLLLDRLPQGRRAITAEVEKLALLSTGGRTSWDDAAALLDAADGGTAHAAMDAALAGDAASALTHWEHAYLAGASGVGFVRTAGGELSRLATLRAAVDGGAAPAEALQQQRIYPRDPRFRRWTGLLQSWRGADVLRALGLVHAAELACKTTGSDERLVVSQLLTRLAGHIAGQKGRVSR